MSLTLSDIKGNLDCCGGLFENRRGNTLTADGAKIGGYLLLRNRNQARFRAVGTVRLFGAYIGGGLECNGGLIEKPDGQALNFEQAQIGGNVLLRRVGERPFTAKGTVIFAGARIAGILGCDGGCFENPGGEALIFDRAQIGGSVFLRCIGDMPFSAKGAVRFLSARIGSDLQCDGGVFENPNGQALIFDRAQIGGSVFLRSADKCELHVSGEVSLTLSDIKGNLDCSGGCQLRHS